MRLADCIIFTIAASDKRLVNAVTGKLTPYLSVPLRVGKEPRDAVSTVPLDGIELSSPQLKDAEFGIRASIGIMKIKTLAAVLVAPAFA